MPNILVPDKCLFCSSPWSGGHEIPGKEMKTGRRVFYDCGASLSVKEVVSQGEGNILLIKNCFGIEGAKLQELDEIMIDIGRGLR